MCEVTRKDKIRNSYIRGTTEVVWRSRRKSRRRDWDGMGILKDVQKDMLERKY